MEIMVEACLRRNCQAINKKKADAQQGKWLAQGKIPNLKSPHNNKWREPKYVYDFVN